MNKYLHFYNEWWNAVSKGDPKKKKRLQAKLRKTNKKFKLNWIKLEHMKYDVLGRARFR